MEDFKKQNQEDAVFLPKMDRRQADALVHKWKVAVEAARVFK